MKRIKRLNTEHQRKEKISAKKLYESIQRVSNEGVDGRIGTESNKRIQRRLMFEDEEEN